LAAVTSFRAEQRDVGGRHVVVLSGTVDLGTVPSLLNVLSIALLDRRGAVVAVDLDGVEALDDVGLGILLGAAGRARRDGGELTVVCSQPRLCERLALTGFDRAVAVTATLGP
jgi:anti-sigma B factor antagonist